MACKQQECDQVLWSIHELQEVATATFKEEAQFCLGEAAFL